jgi:cystathionine beta-lyase/cystathionine gamma-synthase
MKLETLAIHAGQHPDPVHGAVMTPIVLSSTFAQDGPGNHKGFDYSRSGNPTRNTLEACAAALEGAKHGLAFSSGCAATTTILHTLRPGDHVVCGDDVYGGTFRILDKVMRPMGVQSTLVDMSDLARFEAALTPATRMVWLESPTNPMLKVSDIAALAARAHAVGAIVAVDNTFATPIYQRPLALGADLVVHSTTKYLNGHSDVVGGVVVTANPSVRAHQVSAERHRRCARHLGLLAHPARHQDLGRARWPGTKRTPWPSSLGSSPGPRWRGCGTPWTRPTPSTPWPAPDERLRRHDQL